MRALVIVLVLLAGAKVFTQEHFYRSATEEALVAAYRDRAIEACQRQAKDAKRPSATAAQLTWAKPASIELVIGKRDVDVRVWDVENELWSTRYKRAFLVLHPADRSQRTVCEFDVTRGAVAFTEI